MLYINREAVLNSFNINGEQLHETKTKLYKEHLGAYIVLRELKEFPVYTRTHWHGGAFYITLKKEGDKVPNGFGYTKRTRVEEYYDTWS